MLRLRPFRLAPDNGSALMLVPAAVLVLVILGAIVVDSAVVFLAHRELNNRAAAAANDSAAVAFDDASYYADGHVCLDAEAVEDVVASAFAPQQLPSAVRSVQTAASVDGRRVTVEVVGEVPLIFAAAIPGAIDTATVATSASATARGSGASDAISCFS